MSDATSNRGGGGGFAHYTIKEPLKGGDDTSYQPYAEGENSTAPPTEEACTAPYTKGAAITLGKAADFGNPTAGKAVPDPSGYGNESRTSA